MSQERRDVTAIEGVVINVQKGHELKAGVREPEKVLVSGMGEQASACTKTLLWRQGDS